MNVQDQNNSIIQSPPVRSTWTNHDHTMFLHAVVNGPDDVTGRWQLMADAIPGKTAEEVKAYYEAVERDLLEIEAGRVELPDYPDDCIGEEVVVRVKKEDEVVENLDCDVLATGVNGSKRREKERKKATPWSEEEHRRFLQGLEVYGKGDWRSISRNMVVTRTPTQVASHAQKYFLRQASLKQDNTNEESNKKGKKRRCSIHDITTADAVHAQPTSSAQPATSLNGGGQSSLTLWPGIQGIITTDTTMVVHAQPISSTPPATSYDSKGKIVPTATTSSSPYICGGQGRGGQPPANFYGGHGRGAPQPLNSVYDGHGGGEPQPLNSFYDGHGGGAPSHPTLPPTHFYGEQGGAPLRYEFIKHLAPTHVKDYTLDEEFSFKNSYLSETNL